MNARTVMSSRGQVVVPKPLRDAHGWREGTEFDVIAEGGVLTLKPVMVADPSFPSVSWQELLAMRPKVERFPTDDEIEETLAAEASRRFDAGR